MIKISKKQNASSGIRTRDVSLETHRDLHNTIKSLISDQFNEIIKFSDMIETVIYFTIYDKMILSRTFKVCWNNFLIVPDRKNIKLISSGTWPAQIDKILKMTLAPPGGRGEVVKVRRIV